MENKKTYVYAAKAPLSAAARGGVLCFQKGVGGMRGIFIRGAARRVSQKLKIFPSKTQNFFQTKTQKFSDEPPA